MRQVYVGSTVRYGILLSKPLRLPVFPTMLDTTSSNDASASLTAVTPSGRLFARIWVAAEDPTDREWDDEARYTLGVLPIEDWDPADHSDLEWSNQDVVLETDDWHEVLTWLKHA